MAVCAGLARLFRAGSMAPLLVAPVGAALCLASSFSPAHATSGQYADPATALHDYVGAEDRTYAYTYVRTAREDGYAVHLLRLTSQQWRSNGEARPEPWRHWLVVVVPDDVVKDVAALVVAGGSRRNGPPSLDAKEIRFGAQLAMLSKTVVAVLTLAPYQPLFFPDEPLGHQEDALVAYSWNKALETGDYSWPVQLPMVKATVRAMDTLQDFVPQVAPVALKQFVVVGASKRGTDAWLTAVADARVKAIAPLVIDVLNFPAQVEHQLAVYGEFPPALADYVKYELLQRVETPAGRALIQVVDPYAYLGALDLPKYIVNSTGDQFFPPDSAQFYFGALPGESMLRYVPNSDHSLSNSEASLIDAVSGLFGWYLAVVNDLPRPSISWRTNGERLRVTASPPPIAARLWQATNPQARDFRLGTIHQAWRATELDAAARGKYVAAVAPPPSGWTAYFVELVYPSPQPGLCQVYSTRVFVTPEKRPFEGTDPATAGREIGKTDRHVSAAQPDRRASSVADDVFQSAAHAVQGEVLKAALENDLADRAIRYCYPRRLQDLDEALDLYARLGFGQPADAVLEDLWNQARHEAEDAIDNLRDRIDDGLDDAEDAIDDVF